MHQAMKGVTGREMSIGLRHITLCGPGTCLLHYCGTAVREFVSLFSAQAQWFLHRHSGRPNHPGLPSRLSWGQNIICGSDRGGIPRGASNAQCHRPRLPGARTERVSNLPQLLRFSKRGQSMRPERVESCWQALEPREKTASSGTREGRCTGRRAVRRKLAGTLSAAVWWSRQKRDIRLAPALKGR